MLIATIMMVSYLTSSAQAKLLIVKKTGSKYTKLDVDNDTVAQVTKLKNMGLQIKSGSRALPMEAGACLVVIFDAIELDDPPPYNYSPSLPGRNPGPL